ncbi:MAG: hypothetical protein ACI9KE_000519 [Polyangiales bacterium]|jgi:hypothetical protein
MTHHSALTLSFVSALAFAGCFSGTPQPDPCSETRRCVAADNVGCCSGGAREISLCQDSCPAGMIEETDCRMAGCGMGCETPLTCRMDYGTGCCGDAVFTTSCDACPAGSVEATACTADYPAECGCGGIRAFRPPADQEAVALFECFEDLGGGCCGTFVGASECGECPSGTTPQFECSMMSGNRIAPPEVTCREDLGGGCCGTEVAANACSAECPSGSVEASTCAEVAGADAPAFPEPASCFELTADGCCGEAVAVTACGSCPAGASTTCDPCEP